MKNKLVAAIITIVVLIAIFPVSALADSGTISTNGTYDIGDCGNDSTITINPELNTSVVNLNSATANLTISGPSIVMPGETYTYTVTISDYAAAILGNVTCGGIFSGSSATLSQDSVGGLSENIVATTTITVTVASNASPGSAGTISVAAQESFSDGTSVTERHINGSRSVYAVRSGVTYRSHVQNLGWQGWKTEGVISGTSGQSLRLEGMQIYIEGKSNAIEYRTHVQDYGWMGWVSDGAMTGTSGESKRLEAIQIRLTGDMAAEYDIYYRVHAQNFGWMDWAKNGASSGTAGYAYRLEAIQIVMVNKGGAAPGSTTTPFREYIEPASVLYHSHVQNIGWQGYVSDGQMSGTSGQSLRLEGMQIYIDGKSNAIEYRTHVQDYGWMGWVSDGEMTGTSGESKRLEAINVRLTGYMATKYDIYYRVHAEAFGWMGWAKNGAPAGSAGYGFRLEAIEIVLVEKGGSAPGSTTTPFRG